MTTLTRKDDVDMPDGLCTHQTQWVDQAWVSEGENIAGKTVRTIMQRAYCPVEDITFPRRRSL